MGHSLFRVTIFLTFAVPLFSQNYQVTTVVDGGTISGTVKWIGTVPRSLEAPITKDQPICDPESKKTTDLERLVVGPEGGVANTIVYLKDISRGKAFDLPPQLRHLDQKHCRYVPHIVLVPQNEMLTMRSSDATLHTIHMDGAATYNLPFPFPDQPTSRTMATPGLVNLRCNGGHVWMNAEMMVVSHPYYVVTDATGRFELTSVPPGKVSDRRLARGLGTCRQGASLRRVDGTKWNARYSVSRKPGRSLSLSAETRR